MGDEKLTASLDMVARLFQARVRVRNNRENARLLNHCLHKWQPRAHMFLAFKQYLNTVKYLQAWWPRKLPVLKEIFDKIAKRWEKIERTGTSGQVAQDTAQNVQIVDVCDQATRTTFIENELRSRRFFHLSAVKIWEEDSAKFQAQV